MNTFKLFPPTLLTVLLVLPLSLVQADIIYLQSNMAGGQTWTNPVYWSDGLAAHAGGDYIVGSGGGAPGNTLRTPEASNPVFPGDSLSIYSGGVMALKHSGTVTVNNLQLHGGTISAWNSNSTMNVGGSLNVVTGGVFEMNGDNRRTIALTANLSGSGNLTLRGVGNPAQFILNANTSAYSGKFIVQNTLNDLMVDNGTMNVTGGLPLSSLRVGYNAGTGSLVVLDGAVNIGSGSQTMWLGRYDTGNANTQGTADFSAASLVNLNLSAINIGTSTGGTSGQAWGTLTLSQSGANTITAGSLIVGDSPNAGNTNNTSQVVLGGSTNTLNVDSVTIGGRKSQGEIIVASGGSVALGSAANRTLLYVGRNNVNSGVNAVGTLDLSGGADFTAYLSDWNIGVKSGGGSGTAKGIVKLAGANFIDVSGAILVGDSPDGGQDTSARESSILLGQSNTIYASSLTLGGRKSDARMTLPSGGSLILGSVSRPIQLNIARNNQNTGSVVDALFDTSAGTAQITATEIILGHKSGGGSGTANGEYRVGDGSTSVAGDIHETGDGGTSAVTVLGDHAFAIGGTVAVDTFDIGLNGTTAAATFTGTASIGNGSGGLYIGRRTAETSAHSVGTLDLRQVDQFTANLTNLGLGIGPSSATAQGSAGGTLLLAEENVITAASITLAHSVSVGLGGQQSRIGLGALNTIAADTVIIGGSKGNGLVNFLAPGGELTLTGRNGGRANVLVGNQTIGTSGGSTGVLDLSGGTFNALLDQLVIASKPNDATGVTAGTVTMAAGEVDVNAIILNRRTQAGTDGTLRSTFNLDGGTLRAGTITRDLNGRSGSGDTFAFNFNGGELHVGQFGTPALPMNLNNTGTGTLAPGNSAGTTVVYGNYTQGSQAALQIELESATAFDLLDVNGLVSLDGQLELLLGYKPIEGSSFLILNNRSSQPITGTFDALAEGTWFPAAGEGFDSTFAITYLGGDGNDVVLTAVPEPLTLGALAMAMAGLGGYVRRRRR